MKHLNFRNAINKIFGKIRQVTTSAWQEVGTYISRFSSFGGDLYQNEVVRACIRTLAEHSSKANVKVIRRTDDGLVEVNHKLARMIQLRPNEFMNGKDFIYKVRTLLELHNTAFIYIKRNDRGDVEGLYPMPQAEHTAKEYMGNLFIQFNFANGNIMTHDWRDLAVLRKDYNKSDIFGDSNNAILTSLELLNTISEGMENAIKSTSNLRGILKSTKAMLSDDDRNKQKERFVQDYLTMANKEGIAVLDSTQEFQALDLKPHTANFKNIEEYRNNIYRYFGLNEDIVMSRASGDEFEAFYEAKLEPFLLALGLELTYKVFTEREIGFGNQIIFEANRLQYASTSTKMDMVQLIDRGILTINEYREILNIAPVEGGDVRVIRKEYAEANKLNEIQGVADEGVADDGDNE